MAHQLVRDFYDHFNQRRVAAAGELFAPDAAVDMPPFFPRAHGADAYFQFAAMWLRAFPDAAFTVGDIEQPNDATCEVHLIATGTHSGPLDLGALGLLRPHGVRLALHMRQLMEIREGRITYTSLSMDLNGLTRQLNRIDYDHLTACLDGIRELAVELAAAGADPEHQREIAERIGQALDAARHVVRPQFRR